MGIQVLSFPKKCLFSFFWSLYTLLLAHCTMAKDKKHLFSASALHHDGALPETTQVFLCVVIQVCIGAGVDAGIHSDTYASGAVCVHPTSTNRMRCSVLPAVCTKGVLRIRGISDMGLPYSLTL